MRRLGAILSKFAVALIFLSAIAFVSCRESINTVGAIEQIDSIATQIIHNMRGIQTEFGKIRVRFEAPLMENYSLLKEPFEIFPQGIKVTTYTPEGEEQTQMTARSAIHKKGRNERWEAYGNVVIKNFLEGTTLETDTLYWDQTEKRIYTHVYIKQYSATSLIQGIGMESNEQISDVKIFKPFDNYGIIERDTLSRRPVDSLARMPVDTVFMSPVDSLLRPTRDTLMLP